MNIGLICFPILCALCLAAIITVCVIMIIKHDGTDWDKKIWIGSKILTLKKLLDKNNNYTYPILSIGREGNIISYNKNYESLLKDSNKDCEKNNYKKCGILDTLGNIMCIPKNDTCPINSLIVDLQSKEDEYINNGYQVAFIKNFSNDSYIYYTNNETDNNIVVKIKVTETIPKYISSENLIFDQDSFDNDYSPSSDDDGNDYEHDYDWDHDDDYDDYHSFSVKNRPKRKKIILRKLDYIFGNNYTDSYIRERFNDEINIDKTYKLISNNLYIGNYLGFKDYNNMKNFSDFDLYDTYMRVLPNKIVLIFCYIISALFTIFIIFYIVKAFRFKVVNNKAIPQYKAILTYLVSTLGLFIYILYEYINIYKTKRALDYTKIEADPFLKDLLLEIQGRHCSESIIIVVLILFSFSIGAFILNRIIFVYCKIPFFKI